MNPCAGLLIRQLALPPAPPPCPAERWGKDWALLALAAADNTALCLEHYGDRLAG